MLGLVAKFCSLQTDAFLCQKSGLASHTLRDSRAAVREAEPPRGSQGSGRLLMHACLVRLTTGERALAASATHTKKEVGSSS